MSVHEPQLLNCQVIAQTRFFTIEELHLRFQNGEERHFERVNGHARGSVMIVPFLDDDTVLLIREYGAGVGEYVLGFPKGSLDREEPLTATANRELKEEIGYGAKRFTAMGKLSASPGYLTSVMQLLLAHDLYPEKLEGDEPEPLEVIPWRLNRVDELLNHPEFYEARSVAALLLVERRYARERIR